MSMPMEQVEIKVVQIEARIPYFTGLFDKYVLVLHNLRIPLQNNPVVKMWC